MWICLPDCYSRQACHGKNGLQRANREVKSPLFNICLLNTSPEVLLEFLEDYALGELMDQVETGEFVEGNEARDAYRAYVAGVE